MKPTLPTASTDLYDVLEDLPQATVRVDAQLHVLWVEPRFAAKTGLWLLVGESLLAVLEPTAARDQLEQAIGSHASFHGELLTRTLKHVQLRSMPAHDDPGEAWVVFERSGLDDDAGFARALLENARTLCESLDSGTLCASAAVAMVRCAQLSRAEVYLVEGDAVLKRVASSDVGRRQSPGADEPPMVLAMRRALESGRPELGVVRRSAASEGAVFAAVPVSAHRRTQGVLVLYKGPRAAFSARELDVSTAAAGQLGVALENSRLLAETQAALRTREEFMSIASHELKTPLTPLKMTLSMMERRLEQGQAVELSAIHRAKRQVDRLTSLVGDLLDASRLDLGKLALCCRPVELGPMTCEVVEDFRGAYDRQFQLSLPDQPLWVNGDRSRLEQVLVNVVDNAHKYSAEGSPVQVSVGRAAGDACIEVVDRGIGIPLADQAQIFERFYRAQNALNRNLGGLGLGLFISQSILRLHGGGMTLASREGEGSRFTVRLPELVAQ